MPKVLVVSTSRKTRGGITAVLRLYEKSSMWQQYHCRWIGTHRDGGKLRKIYYFIKALALYVVLLPCYDIVHLHFSLPVSARRKYPFFRVAKLFGKKIVIHLHCGSQIDDIWSPIYQKMFEECDCGIVLSEGLKRKVEERIGKSDKLRVVYNPCPIISNTGHFSKRNTILFSGTLYEGKGYKDLIRAFAMIAHQHPDWKIVLAGNGEVEQARSLATNLGIINQVELLGWVSGEAKHKVFCEAKALCLPSYAEGFPMAVLDAWAYGLPVITTPVGGVPDVAINDDNMLLFDPGDVDKMAECLDRMISDDELRAKLSAESQKLAADKFNLSIVTDELGRIYEGIN